MLHPEGAHHPLRRERPAAPDLPLPFPPKLNPRQVRYHLYRLYYVVMDGDRGNGVGGDSSLDGQVTDVGAAEGCYVGPAGAGDLEGGGIVFPLSGEEL